MRRVVDLPQPEGPTRTMNSRSRMSRSMALTAGLGLPGYILLIFSRVTRAITPPHEQGKT